MMIREQFTQKRVQLFWDKVQRSDSNKCWEWQRSLTRAGYGNYGITTLCWGGLAHRFSYMLHNGDIPEGMFVCHTCDNRRCVNPDHLFLGSNKDNMEDRVSKNKGKTPTQMGSLHPLSKLTERQVVYARNQYRAGRSVRDIAQELNIPHGSLGKAITGRTWKHVPDPVPGPLYAGGNRHGGYKHGKYVKNQ